MNAINWDSQKLDLALDIDNFSWISFFNLKQKTKAGLQVNLESASSKRVAVKVHIIINIKDNIQIGVIFRLAWQLEIIFPIWDAIALNCWSPASFAEPWMLLSYWPSLWFTVWSYPVPFLPFSYGTVSTIVNYCYSCFTFPSISHLHLIAFRIRPHQFNSIFCLNSQVFVLLISPILEEFHFPMHFWILSELFYW